ncbi:V-type ATP synthase subunit I [Candidatus Woesearchaeota archaeon]|nr:V-type ATP synthase subunit I [Candidatus Woesearchaeota archaeon]
MFIPERMRKVTVIGPQTVMERTVKELYRLKAVHVSDHKQDDGLDIGSPFEKAERLSSVLVTVRAVSAALGIAGKKELTNGFRAVGLKNLSELERAVRKLNDEVSRLLSARKEAEDELRKIAEQEAALSRVEGLGLDIDVLSQTRSLAFFIGTVKDSGKLKVALSAMTDKFDVAEAEESSGQLIALFIESSRRDDAAEVLAKSGFVEFQIEPLRGLSGSPGLVLEALGRKREKLQKQVEAAGRSISRLSSKWNDFVLLSEQIISSELEKAEAPLRFGVGKKFFVVKGWVPASELNGLEAGLGKAAGERIFVESEAPHHSEMVPVRMDNPKPARPFEFFMNLYALPRYDEIDPTLFMFVTFPLFFGFILGDVGYGLVTFFLLLWLKEKFGASSKLISLMIPAAISSVVFGFVFGEVFDFEHAFGYEFPHLISRAHQVNEMMLIAVAVGLVHLNLGFVLGFINELHHKGIFKAFAAKLSWILLQAAAALAYLSFSGRIGMPWQIFVAAAVACVVLISYGEGLKAIEILGLPSNILSYARLMAVGLSSVILAVVVNDLSGQIAQAGVFGVIASIILLFIGHTLNLALGLLGGFLHSLRLHYVEFFTKFFEGGAIPFRPFGSRRGE